MNEEAIVIDAKEFLEDLRKNQCPEPSKEEMESFGKTFRVYYEKDRVYPKETMPIKKDCCLYRETPKDGMYCDQIGDGSQSISLDKGCAKDCILYHKKHKD